MNKQAIEHSHESKYCFYLNDKTCLIRVRTQKDDTIKKIEVIWNEWCKLWKEQKITELKLAFSDDLFSYFEATIESQMPSYEYVIRFTDEDGKIYYLADDGLTDDFSFERLNMNEFMSKFPNDVDKPKLNKNLCGRIYYSIFPDRFCCSDFSKSYINMKWDEKDVNGHKFMGGDIKGIISKLPYLKSLGIGGVWLNPINTSDSAHKYDVNNYYEIDPMFGTLDDFKMLLDEAHKLDIKIVMDLVFNHCAYNNILFQDVVKNGKKSKYFNWFYIDGDKPDFKKRNYLTFANVGNMPKLNTSNPEVIKYFSDVTLYWADLGVDGFRLDVAFEVSYHFWNVIKSDLLKKHPDAFFIGEDWLTSEKRLDNYQWDSLMNYPFRYALGRYIKEDNKDSKWISERLSSLYVRYNNIYNHMMLNLLDSHDIERWYNVVNFDRDKYFLTFAILMFYPGVPMIYYGDEIFMEGWNDPFNRRGMEWDSKEFNGKDHQIFKQLLGLKKFDSIKTGDVRFGEENGVAFIRRFTNKESYTLYFYKGEKPLNFSVKSVIFSNNYENGEFQKTGFVMVKD